VLATRAALEEVVDRLPSEQAAFRECLGREWRAEVLAPVLLPVVEAWRSEAVRSDAQPA